MTNSSLGEAVLELRTDDSKLDRGIDSAKGKSEGLASQFNVTKLAVVGAIATMGAAALKLGGDFDKAVDSIRIGTGATGEQLSKLQSNFANVFATVPTDAGSAATAIADLNTRLGLTGQPLEAMATQFLNLSRITGTDLSTNVANVTRVFGDWTIAAEDQAGAMDFLFKTTQQTGIGIDKLSGLVVQFGAPLRQLGFDFESSAALMGKFEKEGVNIETVMAGMKMGLTNMGKAGMDGAEGMAIAVEGIKNAGTQAEANTAAMLIFGQRAGPDMAAAIREGRFELDELLGNLRSSTDGINIAATATDDWRESMMLIGNAIKVAFAGELDAGFQLLGVTTKALAGFLALIVEGSNALYGWGKAAKEAFGISTAGIDKSIKGNKELAARLKEISISADKASDPKFTNWLKGVAEGTKGAVNPTSGLPAVGNAVTGAAGAANRARPSFDELMKRIKTTGDDSKKAAEELKKVQNEFRDLIFPMIDATAGLTSMNAAGELAYRTWDEVKKSVEAAKPALEDIEGGMASIGTVVIETGRAVEAFGDATKVAHGAADDFKPKLDEYNQAMKDLGATTQEAADKNLADLAAALERVRAEVQKHPEKMADLKRAQEAYDKAAGISKEKTNLWGESLKQVSTVLTDLGSDLSGRFSNAVKTGIGPIDDFSKAIIRLVSEQVMGAMIKGLASIVGHIPGLTKLAGILTGIGGGAANAAGGVAGAAGGAGGAGGATGAAIGGGLSGAVGLITGAVSAVSGVIGNFQMKGMNKTLDLIEHEVRFSQIHLLNLLNNFNQAYHGSGSWAWLLRGDTATIAAALKDGVPMLVDSTRESSETLKQVADTGQKTLERVSRHGEENTNRLLDANLYLENISGSIESGNEVARQSRDALVASIEALPEGIGREVGHRFSEATADSATALSDWLRSIPTHSALGRTADFGPGMFFRGQRVGPGSIDTGGERTSRVPQFQSGIDFLPKDTLALLHRGEAVIPAEENRGRLGEKQPVEIRVMLQTGKEIARALIPDINDLVERNRYRLLASGVVA